MKINPKKILSYALLGILLVFILVLTWIPIVFDIDHLDVNKWVTNSLINVGIMICAIILGEIFGDDKQKTKPNGLYQQALQKFSNKLKELEEGRKIIIYFSQFYIWFKALELKRKKESYLIDHGFDQMVAHSIVKYVDFEDVGQMRAGAYVKKIREGKEIKFRRISEEEYLLIKDILSPDFQIDAPEYTYYLSAFGGSSSASTLEQAKIIERKQNLNKTFNRTFKILLAVFISFLFGLATVQDLTDGGAREAIMNTITRLLALISGLLSGFLTSIVAVKLASQKLDNKTQVLTFMEIHYDNKDFIPKTYDELVEEDIRKEEEEKAKVITPEVMKEDEPAKEADTTAVAVVEMPLIRQ